MLNTILTWIALFISFTQIATTPTRVGDVARQLTQEEIGALQATLPSAEKPWLLIGDPAQAPLTQYIEAFLTPRTASTELRRGPLIWVMRRMNPRSPNTGYGSWAVDKTEDYAQVSLPGRQFDQIESDQDINRPFR